MAERDPLINPRPGDVIRNHGVTRTIIYTTVYGKVYYENISGVRKQTELNSYRKWAENGECDIAPPSGWSKLDAMVDKAVQAEAQKICDHFAQNHGHPTRDLLVETLLEFGVAVACSGPHSREKVYAALRRKMKERN